MYRSTLSLLLAGASLASAALQVDFGSISSIKAAAHDVASDVMFYYKGNQPGETPGLLGRPPPAGEYYWWTGAILWSTMLDYWHYANNKTYNSIVREALLWQNGHESNRWNLPFLPLNVSAQAGNDDQAFWALAAMQAAEFRIPDPPKGEPGWIELAQGVFNSQVQRWDSKTCGGGLRWMIVPTSKGYNLKNTASNAAFFTLAARLARYTDNQTYTGWAEKTWTWLSDVGLMDKDSRIFDLLVVDQDCTKVNKFQLSYDAGLLLQGAAYMYNHTTDSNQATWRTRLGRLANTTLATFFSDGPLVEIACEGSKSITCNSDMVFYKGITMRALASAATLAPFLRDQLMREALRPSAEAAIKTCDGGVNGRECGFRWAEPGAGEKKTGVPMEMNALSAVLGSLVDDDRAYHPLATNESENANRGGGARSGGSQIGSESQTGTGSGAGDGADGDGKSAGATTHVAVGLVVAAFVAALA
ncbi:hypothetical protein VTI74DRAFT_10738 [Chaetomium olivicolor]